MSVTDEPVTISETGGNESAGGINDFINVNSLQQEIERNAKINRDTCKPFRQYQKRVIVKAGVPNTQATRELTSNICGAVARLPFVPDDKVTVETRGTEKITEFDLQAERTAFIAESALASEMVWTSAARKLAKAALELRRQDPDGKKGVSWVTPTGVDDSSVLDN